MTTLPSSAALAGDDVTVAQFQTAIAQLRSFVYELLGGGGTREQLEIINGIVTVSQAVIQIDTEGGAASDQLDQILPTNMETKFIIVRCANSVRPITLKHMMSGNGRMSFSTLADVVLDSTRKWIWMRYDDTLDRWEEVNRNWGLITISAADQIAAVAALNLGLGTAAFEDEGPTGGLDADTLDGVQGSSYMRKDSSNALSSPINMQDQVLQRPLLQDEAAVAVQESATGSYTVDLTRANVFRLTLTGATTLSFTNPPVSGRAGLVTIYFKQDATGGRTVTYPGTVIWPGGVVPTFDTAANKVNVVTFSTLNAGGTWYAHPAGLGFAS